MRLVELDTGTPIRPAAETVTLTVDGRTVSVPAGTSVKEAVRLQLLTETATAAKALPAGALTSVTPDNEALLALTDIPPGQYVLRARLDTKTSPDAALTLT